MNYRVNNKIEDTGHYILDILRARGISEKNIVSYLSPNTECLLDNCELRGIEEGIDLLLNHIKNHSKIYLQSDPDNDGMTSAAMMYLAIKNIDLDADIYWAVHSGKQHGIDMDKIKEGTSLVIAPDASSNEPEKHKELVEAGIDVLVLDHHESNEIDDNAIIINNQLCDYENKDLTGAGVVFKFLKSLDKRLGINFSDSMMDLAASGMIGDMCLLNNLETRYIVSEGLSNIQNFGLKTFANKQAFSIGSLSDVSPMSISFYIVPLVNAIIRVGTQEEKEILFRSFIEGNIKVPSTKRGAKPGDTEILAEQAFRFGTNCRNRQNKILEKASDFLDLKIQKEELLDNKILIITLDDLEAEQIPSELGGLVAMKLTQKYNRPTLVLREADDGCYKGSGRGLNDSAFDDFKKFLNDSGMFEFAQGHANAFGASLPVKNKDKFIRYSNNELKDFDFGETYYEVDYEFTKNDLKKIDNLAFALEPYGKLWGRGVEEVKIAAKQIPFTSSNITVMGKTGDSCKITIDGISFVRFKDKKFVEMANKYDFGSLTIVGKTQINEWCGRKNSQVIIEDYEIRSVDAEF